MDDKPKIKYMQTRVTPEEFKTIKKKAIDLGLDVEDLIKDFVLTRISEEETHERD